MSPSGLSRRDFHSLTGGMLCAAFASTAGMQIAAPQGVSAMKPGSESITLFLCGDVMTGRGIDQILPHPGDPRICERYVQSALGYLELAERANGRIPREAGFDYIWGDALSVLEREAPDLRLINLETSVTTSDDCTDRGISYRMNPANLPCLAAAGIDYCGLANNHVLDWGHEGLLETLDTLKGAGLKIAGAGRNRDEAAAPAIMKVPGKGRVLVFAAGAGSSGIPPGWAAGPARPGVNFLTDLSERKVEEIATQIRAVKRQGDVVVASIHWGGNWGYDIPRAQRRFAHGLIDGASVDVVHGHSSHHAKGIEVYRGRPILYGSGDMLNDYEGIRGYERYRDDLVLMYFLSMGIADGQLVRCRAVPMRIKNFRLNRSSRSEAEWLAEMLNREGARFGSSADLSEDGNLDLSWG